MTAQNFSFARNGILPSFWANRIQDMVTGHGNFGVTIASTTSVQVVAGDDNNLVSIPILGRWRFNIATVARTMSGSAGKYRVWVVASDNSVASSPQPFTDNTTYAFDLRILADGSTPSGSGAEAIYREVANLQFDGTKIVWLNQTVGKRPPRPGDLIPHAGQRLGAEPLPQGLLHCKGELVNISDYPALFGMIGHQWNNGAGDPGGGKFRLPDMQRRRFTGRSFADGGLTNVGDNDGVDAASRALGHTHTSPAHAHGPGTLSALVPAHFHGKGTLNIPNGGVHAHAPQGGGYFIQYGGGESNSGSFYYGDGPYQHWVSTIVANNTHAHTSSEFAGSVGNTGGQNGDGSINAPLNSGASSPTTITVGQATDPYGMGVWLITTGT